MKKAVVFILLICCGKLWSQSQNESSSIQFHSVSLTPLSFYSANSSDFINLGADFTLAKGKHLYSLDASIADELEIFGKQDSFRQLNVLYGRQFVLSQSIHMDAHIGAGYFGYRSFDSSANNGIGGEVTKSTVGVPLKTKLRFLIGNKFSMGLQLHANINLERSIVGAGLVFQFNGKSKKEY